MNRFVVQIKKPKSVLYLVIISLISLCLKFYFIDLSIPVTSDNLDYLLMGISYVNGDFSQSTHRAAGWPMFVSVFYQFLDHGEFHVYSNVIKILSIVISTATIPLVYIVARKFFVQKYALVCAGLLAFEPHLNYNSGFGLSEPIFIASVLLSFFFILNKNSKFIIPSLIFAAAAWWIKVDGFFIFFIISVIYFITYRRKDNLMRNYIIALLVFIIIISPMLIQKQDQFGNPFYSHYSDVMFAGSYEELLAENTKFKNSSAYEYIENEGATSFIYNFILKGIYNIFLLLSKISFPYLFILIPFGIIFSFRAFDQDTQYVKANWIFILLATVSMIVTLAIVAERRYLFYLIPFFIIFSVIPIQRVTEYGLSTFSFSTKQRNLFLLIVLGLALSLSIYFSIYIYEKTDSEIENEKLRLSEFLITNVDGNVLRDFSDSTEYLNYQYVTTKNFKEFTISQGMNFFKDDPKKINIIFISGDSLEELIQNGKDYELKYIIVYEDNNIFHNFLGELYVNEQKYPFMEKIFDSDKNNFERIKVKIFEINYEKFNKILNE